ncbi:50S ribosomal protein L21 [Candidatus Uhrbacteria bacterium]|nr:50S ribosomal protein L21 [Candidatus Uhrbacteria bacterium]
MGNIAVIATGGKQYLVRPGDKVKVEKLEGEPGKGLKFDPLLIADEAGGEVKVGKPQVKGGSVTAEIVRQGRSKKVEVVKFKSKVRYTRRAGHRQDFTEIQIKEIKG